MLQVGNDEWVDVAVQNGLGIRNASFRAMVSHHRVRMEHIRSNSTSEPGGNSIALKLLTLVSFGLHLFLEQAGSQDLEGSFAVLQLTPLILAGDNDAGRNMREPNCRRRLVD